MEKLIAKVFEEKMIDGSIKKIISDKIEELIKNSLNDMFGYNGTIREQMKEKLEDVMGNVLESTDFSNYVIKLQTLINEVLPETALVDYKKIVNNISEVCGKKQPEVFTTIKVSEIFDKYMEFIKKETFSKDDISDCSDIEEGSAWIDCQMEVDEDSLKFSISGVDNAEEYEYNIELDTFSGKKEISYSFFNDKKLKDLIYANSFELFILVLRNKFIKLEIDKYSMEETVDVEVEY